MFSFRAINYLVRQLTAHDASWDAYFLGLGYEPLKLTYEELGREHRRRRPARARAPRHPGARRIWASVGRPTVPDGASMRAPRLSVQADEMSEEWVRAGRWSSHLRALEDAERV